MIRREHRTFNQQPPVARNSFRFPTVLAAFVLLGALTGCLPESYLSAPTPPTRSNNTWLLGVWETPKEEGKGVFRAVVTPVSSDRFLIFLEDRDAQGKVLQSASSEAWISRVGDAYLVTCKSPDPAQAGRYLVFGYQLLDPLNVRVRELTLPEGATEATSFQLRKAIRRGYKDATIFRGEDQVWQKTGEIFWNPDGSPATDTFAPPRNIPPVDTP
jgi:hypothetical protein